MPALEVRTEPASLVDVFSQCDAIETWASECDSVAELKQSTNELAAMDEYLSRTSTEGRSRVAATMRRLEVRIGELLGPAERGGDHGNQYAGGKSAVTETALSADQRHEFRQMADHPEVVEEVIEQSTDESPASRRQVLEAIKTKVPKTPEVPASLRERIAGVNEDTLEEIVRGVVTSQRQELAEERARTRGNTPFDAVRRMFGAVDIINLLPSPITLVNVWDPEHTRLSDLQDAIDWLTEFKEAWQAKQ